MRNFYSRPCGRGDDSRSFPHRFIGSISTHAPAGGATRHSFGVSAPRSFLLTPLREGRLSQGAENTEKRLISTHAPAGGATPDIFDAPNVFIVFLLTPLREGRQNHLPPIFSAAFRFLLTPLREGRPGDHVHALNYHSISTHAPAGGATGAVCEL